MAGEFQAETKALPRPEEMFELLEALSRYRA
jgi:hypothetical protein